MQDDGYAAKSAGIAFAFLMMGRDAAIFASAIARGESDARGLLIYVGAEAAISGAIASFPLAFVLWGVLELMLRFGRSVYSRALHWSVSLGLIFSCAIALLPFTLGRHERPTPRDIFWISTFCAVAPLCAWVFWLCAQPEQLGASLARPIQPPYVLVGHSIGGLYVHLYARRHPDEVAGLVLVDSTHPEQLSGAGAREKWPGWVKLVIDLASPEVAQAELDALPATGAALLALPPFTGRPVTVLSASTPMTETSELARDGNAKRIDILRLNPGARQVWVDSGHAVPLEKPEAIVGAVREILSTLRRQER